MFTLLNLLVVGSLFAAQLALQEAGRWLALRDQRLEPADKKSGTGATEAAVFGLLGLLIAFTFSGAASRYDARRHLIVEETNAIGTAWLRIDLLPTTAQPPLRDLFRQYVDARLESYSVSGGDAEGTARAIDLQRRIWSTSLTAAKTSQEIAPSTVLLPAINQMIDVTTTRAEARRMHPPFAVFVVLGVFVLIGSLFAGYSMATTRSGSRLYRLGLASVVTMALFVIIDFEFPRFGLIRIDRMDAVLVDLRRAMD